MVDPLISVIVTTYNRPQKLERALKSLETQTFQNFEVVVVDDASTTNNVEVIQRSAISEDRLIYYKRTTNWGNHTLPKNDGIKLSKGRFIAYLDDDNEYEPDHLETLYSELTKNDVDIVYGQRLNISEDGAFVAHLGSSSEFDPSILVRGNFIDTSDVLHKRECIYYVGGWKTDIKRFADWDLWWRLFKAGFRFKRVRKVITKYYFHEGRNSEKQPAALTPEGGYQPPFDPLNGDIYVNQIGEPIIPKVAFLTLTWERLEYTKRCFESLSKTISYPFDHFVTDNGSKDGTVEYLRKLEEDGRIKKLILNKQNMGISIGLNQGLDAMDKEYDIVVFLDNDCELITKGWLETMIEIYKTNHWFIMSPFVEGLVQNKGGVPRYAYIEIRNIQFGLTQHLGGICRFTPARIFHQGYRLRTDDYLHGSQDLDFSRYATGLGYIMGYLEQFQCYHMDTTTGQDKKYPEYVEKRREAKTIRGNTL